MQTSNKGIKLIQKFEGCRLRAYDDIQPSVVITSIGQVRGTLTIGYGHTGSDVYVGQKITQSAATNLLKRDLVKFERIVSEALKVEVSQNAFDALVSHAYNCGNINTIAKYLNADKLQDAITYTLRPNTSGGKVLAGLTRRRKAEHDLFTEWQVPTTTVKYGSDLFDVAWLQDKLNSVAGTKLTVDGKFGSKTSDAVTAYQKSLGWNPTGKAGAKTIAALSKGRVK